MYAERWMIVSANENATYDFAQKKVVKNPTVTLNRVVTVPGGTPQPNILPGAQISFPVEEGDIKNWTPGRSAQVQITPQSAAGD